MGRICRLAARLVDWYSSVRLKWARRLYVDLALDVPLDDGFCDKAHHAKGKTNKNDKGAELAGFGLPCQVSDDEQHVQHEAAHAKGEAKASNLFF